MLSLQDSADYQDKFKDLESVALTDTVTVYVPEYGINVTAIVNEIHFDPIQERVTKLTVGTARMSFADSSRVQLSDLQDKVISVQNQADAVAVSANGKSTNYYGSVEPSHPQEGDTWFWVDGDKSGIKVFVNGDWVEPVDSDTQEKIAASVTDAVTQAKAYSDQLVATNREQVNAVLDDVQAKQADLTAQQAELDTKAQGYANKALADAKANTLATATQTAKDAQEYTDTAKAEAISAATTADGVINQKIDDTASSITRTISQNKSDADGKISTAQSTATQALDGLTQKVSQNIYDAKVNELTGKISTAQQTADGAVTTIGNYKQSNDGRVASAESAIQQNASAITQKVSQIDYDQKTGELSGKISQVSQTAGQISQTVSDVKTQVDGLSVGGRNLYTDTKNFDNLASWWGSSKWTKTTDSYNGLAVIQTTQDWSGISQYIQVKKGDVLTYSVYAKYTSGTGTSSIYWKLSNQTEGSYSTATTNPDNNAVTITDSWQRISLTITVTSDGYLRPRLERTNTNTNTLQIAGIKVEQGNMPTDWTPAPEDVDNKISTVSQTVDGIISIVSDPTTGLTKRVQTAEGSISTVQSNVSDLQSKQTQTASGLTTEISDRQNGDTNTLTQAKYFTTSSISNSESGMKSLITQTSDAILGKVGAVNLFPNSEFEKDYGYSRLNGNTTLSLGVKNDVDGHLNGTFAVTSTAQDWQGYWASNIPVYGGQSYSASVLVHYTNGGLSNGDASLDVWFIDKDGGRIIQGIIGPGGSNISVTGQVSSPYWVKLYIENVIAPINAVNMQVSLLVNDAGAGQTAMFAQPMVTATEKLQPYTPNNDITTQLALLKDNWSIGIADNAGAITSGIVGNSTNMSLISNNVVINAPSTQIKGTAWINSAMIGNGQIGTAQIGDAAITNAKIANLDVSKITGNVTNFIQSNWNGVYESTTITNDGMKIMTSDVTTTFGPYGIKLTQGGESVGGIGVSSYVGMPANFQGIAFNLDGTGDYMTWGARASGVTTGDYATKLSWFRSSYKPSGQNAGFNFSDDSPVTFWGDIYGRENTEPLKIASFGMKGVSAGGIGHGNGSSAITFGGDGETYIISSGTYYKLAQFVKALQPLIGLGTWSAPKNINSSGVVTQWTNITT